MQRLLQDVRYALRTLRANPGFTAVAILTLALGIGANTAIFSLTDQVLLRTLPVQRPEELVVLHAPGSNPGHTWSDGDDSAMFSFPMYKDLLEHSSVFSGLLARYPDSISVAAKGQTAERSNGELVSGNYFDVLGVTPALGRVFTADDETAPGANPVAVLSYGYWTRRFGGDPGILNKELTVNGTALTVVGVTRAGFTGIQVGQVPDVFIPITMKALMTPNWDGLAARNDHWVAILGRLKPGYTPAKAEAAMAPAFRAILESELPVLKLSAKTGQKYVAKTLKLDSGARGRQIFQSDAQKPLVSLMIMVGLVLLIACANLASLMIARGEARQREIALRLALGASRWRLVRQLLTESLLLALAGGVAGIFLASWTLGALVGSLRQNISVMGLAAQLDYRVLAFAFGLSILTGILFGFAPAMRSSRADLQATLKDQGANVSEGRSNVRLRKLLMISQVALTAVLLATAGFFAQTLWNLKQTNLGIRTDHVVEFSVAPGLSRYSPAQTLSLFDRMRERIAALPGVRSVTAATIPLLADDDSGGNITPEGYTMKPDEDTHAHYNYVSPNYFSTMGIPLLSGREFRDSDSAMSPKITIVNETLAKTYFEGRSPVGMRIAFGAGNETHPDIEIVGVVKDSKHTNVREVVKPFMYLPYAQEATLSRATFYVRTAQDPTALVLTLRKLVQGFDANLPMFGVSTLAQQADESVYADRLLTAFSLCLGLLAALLAAIGLYGVLAYVVARRTRELGIRIALGASKQNVAWLILREVVRMCTAGLAIGLVAAFGLGKLIESQLFGVKASDPRVFAIAAILLTAVAMVAGWLPARKAASVDPIVALRHE